MPETTMEMACEKYTAILWKGFGPGCGISCGLFGVFIKSIWHNT
jgi:hypothetical protein